MVRINLIKPKYLSDQHLIAEYNEILKLFGHVKKHPKAPDVPETYCLGKGHITFFKNKLSYLKKRHDALAREMKKRGFNCKKTIKLSDYPPNLINDWKPCEKDKAIIKTRLIEKINKNPEYYRYYKKKKSGIFFIRLIKKSELG